MPAHPLDPLAYLWMCSVLINAFAWAFQLFSSETLGRLVWVNVGLFVFLVFLLGPEEQQRRRDGRVRPSA